MIRKASGPFVEEVVAHEISQGEIKSDKKRKERPGFQAPFLFSRYGNNFGSVAAGKAKYAAEWVNFLYCLSTTTRCPVR